ncbi:hypothetical protein K439DRAFT_1611537 [Ramaria rubella]|nr:hypothetical protein K439DRAFT_1611537 [Ramaria rubella]
MEATFLILQLEKPLTDEELIVIQAWQLEKHDGDLADIHERVLKAHYTSISQFEKDHKHTIHDYNFKPGALVLVRNTWIEADHTQKCKPHYLGPMIIVKCTHNGAYCLAKLNGAVAKLPYAAFHLIPYYPRSHTVIPVTSLIDPADIPVEDEA